MLAYSQGNGRLIPTEKPHMGRELITYRRIKTYCGTYPTDPILHSEVAAMSFRGQSARGVLTGFMGAGKSTDWPGRLPKELAANSLECG